MEMRDWVAGFRLVALADDNVSCPDALAAAAAASMLCANRYRGSGRPKGHRIDLISSTVIDE